MKIRYAIVVAACFAFSGQAAGGDASWESSPASPGELDLSLVPSPGELNPEPPRLETQFDPGSIIETGTLPDALGNVPARLCLIDPAPACVLEMAFKIMEPESDTSPDKTQAQARIAETRAQLGMFDAAYETYKDLPTGIYKRDVLRALIGTQIRVGMYDAALRSAEGLVAPLALPGDRDQALKEIADAMSADGLLDRAMEIAASIEIPAYRAEALGKIAVAQARAGQFDAALQTAAGIVPEAGRETYTLDDLVDIEGDTLAKIAILQARVGQFDAALQTAASIVPEGETDRFRLNAPRFFQGKALVQLAVAQARADQFDRARETAERIDLPSLRADALSQIALILVEKGAREAAMQSFTAALETAGKSPETLARIALAQARAGMMGAAEKGFDAALQAAESQFDQVRYGALSAIGTAQAEAGMMEAAQQSFAAALRSAAKVYGGYDHGLTSWEAAQEVAQAQMKAGVLGTAVETASRVGPHLTDLSNGSPAQNEIVDALARAGRPEEALVVAAMMPPGTPDRAEAYTKVAMAFAGSGRADDASRAFAAALESASAIEGNWDGGAIAIAQIATAKRKLGMEDSAKQYFAAALVLAVETTNRRGAVYALTEIARILAEGRQRF